MACGQLILKIDKRLVPRDTFRLIKSIREDTERDTVHVRMTSDATETKRL
jgi:hypothetical protein